MSTYEIVIELLTTRHDMSVENAMNAVSSYGSHYEEAMSCGSDHSVVAQDVANHYYATRSL